MYDSMMCSIAVADPAASTAFRVSSS
eukprot:COSAG01_NODE_74737_length_201_cov_337.088235_2_plen_25_part_01